MEKIRTSFEGNLCIMIYMSTRRAAFRLVQWGVMEGLSIRDMVIPQSVAHKAMQQLPLQRNPIAETLSLMQHLCANYKFLTSAWCCGL